MIGQLRGEVIDIHGGVVTIDVAGVGYEVFGSRALVDQLAVGSEARVLIHTDVKEDSLKLYGFVDSVEKQLFLLLLRVSGIGSKTALEIISGFEGRELLRAIGAGDVHRLQAIKGIGRKTAERIILELRDRVIEVTSEVREESGERKRSGKNEAFRDAVEALLALGFSRGDAESAVHAVEKQGAHDPAAVDPGLIVKEALRFV